MKQKILSGRIYLYNLDNYFKENLINEILIIGNGFDLAHGLPTKYEHFLKFMYSFIEYKTAKEEGKELGWNDGEDVSYYRYFKIYLIVNMMIS